MNRRRFVQAVAVIAALPSTILTTGCAGAKTYLTILINAIQAILPYIAGPIGTQISGILTQISADISTWTSGTLPQDIAQLLTDLRGILDSLPLGKVIDSLVSIAVSAIESLLSATSPTGITANAVTAHIHPVPNVPLKTAHQLASAWNHARAIAGLPASVDVKDGLL